MNLEIGNAAEQFNSWECMFQIFCTREYVGNNYKLKKTYSYLKGHVNKKNLPLVISLIRKSIYIRKDFRIHSRVFIDSPHEGRGGH
jgi:hypothetical protein